jgi:hypothetical protein
MHALTQRSHGSFFGTPDVSMAREAMKHDIASQKIA